MEQEKKSPMEIEEEIKQRTAIIFRALDALEIENRNYWYLRDRMEHSIVQSSWGMMEQRREIKKLEKKLEEKNGNSD